MPLRRTLPTAAGFEDRENGHELRDAVASGGWGQPSVYSSMNMGTSGLQLQGTGSANSLHE